MGSVPEKRKLFLRRKAMTNIGKIMKNKGISMATKFKIVEAMDFQWQRIAVKSRYLERARERK